VPRSTSALNATILFVIFGLLVILVYGRSLPAVVIATAGVLVSAEALFHVARRQFWFLPWYAGYLIVQTAVSVGVGAAVLAGVGVQCGNAANPSACANTGTVFGLALALGASAVGTFAAVSTLVVYYAVRAQPPDGGGELAARARKLAL